jgi:hypothetical protein
MMAFVFAAALPGAALGLDAKPPNKPVKLIFIHHSCGENWLAEGNGNLGRALGENNYFVSDTNYGWGPDGIGDRTDITNWPEWFIGPNSRRYLKALYRESGIHAPYSRPVRDPGGENRIILFKSCFPNSNLRGRPDDRPKKGGGLSVGHAKAIYNALLKYFANRPDKLFIAVTAPPVQDRTYSRNARAFNRWLVQDWLAGYQGRNVAVFDFYNVLTGPNNHHRVRNGAVDYITDRGGNTLYYPTNGDDHPSSKGNRKATREFVPLLNGYYNLWKETAPETAARETDQAETDATPPHEDGPRTAAVAEKSPEPPPAPVKPGDGLDDFENPPEQWTVFYEQGKNTSVSFRQDKGVSHSGKAALCIDYRIDPKSWGLCSLVYNAPNQWSHAGGIEVYLRGERQGQSVTIVAYQGNSSDKLSHFEYRVQIGKAGVEGWQKVQVSWDQFKQPSWEGDGTARFDPNRAMGMAFAFDSPDSGRIWVDDIDLVAP